MPIIDSYEVDSEALFQGAQGTVFPAVSLTTNQRVAVKTYSTKLLDAFRREIYFYSQLQDAQHCLRVHDYFVHHQCGYLVMDLLKTDVLEEVTRLGSIPEKRCKKIFRDVCMGLKECHEQDFAHLDIKPDNILLDEDDNAYLCDFGNSAAGLKTKLTGKRGTHTYAPPEVQLGNAFQPDQVDSWSLGATLYVMLTGYFPVECPSHHLEEQSVVVKMMMNILRKARVSSACIDLMGRLMSIDPLQRPSVDEILRHPWLNRSAARPIARLMRKAKTLASLPGGHQRRPDYQISTSPSWRPEGGLRASRENLPA